MSTSGYVSRGREAFAVCWIAVISGLLLKFRNHKWILVLTQSTQSTIVSCWIIGGLIVFPFVILIFWNKRRILIYVFTAWSILAAFIPLCVALHGGLYYKIFGEAGTNVAIVFGILYSFLGVALFFERVIRPRAQKAYEMLPPEQRALLDPIGAFERIMRELMASGHVRKVKYYESRMIAIEERIEKVQRKLDTEVVAAEQTAALFNDFKQNESESNVCVSTEVYELSQLLREVLESQKSTYALVLKEIEGKLSDSRRELNKALGEAGSLAILE
mmetsp:Transcript_6445/g.11472  ORF Transcript_6445/g.11472 Transcript_6445/m.11472 type:complete len:274 (+) Transcript_6445:71-892(+)